MKTSFKLILVVVFSSIFVTSCSRKKDKFINRSFHAISAEYNTLYNGYLALEQGRTSLNEDYKDNYWDLLPIERMQIREEIILPGQSKNEKQSPHFQHQPPWVFGMRRRYGFLLGSSSTILYR